MNWLEILKADQLSVLEQSEGEAQAYWDYHVGLALGQVSPFKGNVERQTNIASSGLVDEYKVYTWIDNQTKLPIMSRTVGFSKNKLMNKDVIFFAGSTGITRLLKTWTNQGNYRTEWNPNNPEANEHGWVTIPQEQGKVRIAGEPIEGKSKKRAKKEKHWLKDLFKPFRGKRYEDIPKEEKYRLEVARAAGYYHSPDRITIQTIADKHSGWDMSDTTNRLNTVSPMYRRTHNYLMDKYKGNWIITVTVNANFLRYYQTSKGGNFRLPNFFTQRRHSNLVPKNMKEIIRTVIGRKRAPWMIHSPTNIDTSLAGQDFGMDSVIEGRGDDFTDNDFDSHGRYTGKTGHQKDIDDANKAETVTPDDEDDETPGPHFRHLMPNIRETGRLRNNEVVNVSEDHCCIVMKDKVKEWLDANYTQHRNLPHVTIQPDASGRRVVDAWFPSSARRRDSHVIPGKVSALLDDLNVMYITPKRTPFDGDCESFKATLEELLNLLQDDALSRYGGGPPTVKTWVEKTLEEWDECSQTVQDKFEHWDSNFTASSKVDRWFGVIKDGGAVTFGGHGEGKQEALFAPKFSNDCGCGKEDCKCQNK